MVGKKIFLFIIVTVAVPGVFFVLYGSSDRENVTSSTPTDVMRISLGDAQMEVEIADTPEKRTLGLSNRENIGETDGLLFIFEEEGTPGFWMKDMKFAIDIIWIDANGTMVDGDYDVSPETYPDIFRSSESVKYVLELTAGDAKTYNIQIGDQMEILE